MIIELPYDSSASATFKRYRMGFFHFSNNNLAIRRDCARSLGDYDLSAKKSEDVDLCFRLAKSPQWVAFREQGVNLRHKARRSYGAMIRQLWGWGFYVGWPYKKTGLKGIHLYWFDTRKGKVTRDLELPGFPFLVCAYFTSLHVALAAGAGAALGAATGHRLLALALGALAMFHAWRYSYDDRHTGLPVWPALKLAGTHLLINLVFSTAVTLGSLGHGVLIIPATIIPTKQPNR